MAEILTKATKYSIEDSNIALLGSDLEKRVREHAGDKEVAWNEAGKSSGTQIWRIEKFSIVDWPKDRYGSFYDGDSYIVLHTYKKTPDTEELSYDLHFWIGEESTQDEAATAAYKTVELDDRLNGLPVEYREVQGYESARFLSYFPRFLCMRGGVGTGFHHVSTTPPPNTKKLYRVTSTGTRLVVREVPPEGSSLIPGDAYVLDLGSKIWQLNTKGSVGKEKFRAAEFVQTLVNDRESASAITVFDEGAHGVGTFLSELGLEAMPSVSSPSKPTHPKALFRLSDASGSVTFEAINPPSRSSISSADAFLLDDSSNPSAPAIYVWIGRESSLTERRLSVQYAQAYLYQHHAEGGRERLAVSIVKTREGHESSGFLQALEGN